MFRVERRNSGLTGAFALLELIYHNTVRSIRQTQGNAVLGLLMNIVQTVIFIAVFYLTMYLLGGRNIGLRGDYLLYLMSGVFLYMMHTKTMGAVFKSEGPASPMMLHAPMNTFVAICSAAIGALYLQMLSLIVILYVYHVAFQPITIEDPAGAMAMVLLAWFCGIGVGMVFLAIKPWWPGFAGLGASIYSRANMIFSGKMFVANTMSYTLLKTFSWNPLFHVIDQARGDVFVNYTPHKTDPWYALNVALALVTVGMMGEFFTRRRASASWGKGR